MRARCGVLSYGSCFSAESIPPASIVHKCRKCLVFRCFLHLRLCHALAQKRPFLTCPSRKCHRAHSQRARLKLRGGDLRVEPMRVVASGRQRCHLWICVQTGRIDRKRNANGESEFRPRGDTDDAVRRPAESQQLGRGRGVRPLARLASFVLTRDAFARSGSSRSTIEGCAADVVR